jgi:asparagine synthase (glutamine-hydrolysing)
MCGIAGVIYFDGRTVEGGLIKTMTDRMVHRGPDGEGVYVDGSVGLGNRRLAIIDLSPKGKQPMCNEDGSLWITYNGEMYNFLELRQLLIDKGHQFNSNTDTEVIVHAYEEWGTECLQRFNGMFAFALWDSRKQQAFIARDRIGIKPLFYHQSENSFAFGSEIKVILPAVEDYSEIDYEALSYYLALNYTPAPFTLFNAVRQLLPGHFMLVNLDGEVRIEQYWRLIYNETNYQDEDYYKQQFTELLEDAVRSRLVSDVPFGAFLSGGIDSSTVSYWMRKNINEKLKTFSIGFEEESYNELEYSNEVAEWLDVDHYNKMVNAELASLLPKMVWHAEEPTADSSMVAVYYLSQLARQHVTMALSGDGADEILAGYETYQAHYLHRLYRLIPGFVRNKVITPLVNAIPSSDEKISWDFKLRRFVNRGDLTPEDAHATWRMIFDTDSRNKLLLPLNGRSSASADMLDLYRNVFAQTNARQALNRLLYVDTVFYLPNDMLVKVDRMSMAHSLEVRVPFLDHRLVEFAASVPPSLKLKNFTINKYLIKAVMKGRLPQRTLTRRKAGFNVPKVKWLRGELKPFVLDTLSRQAIQQMGFLDYLTVDKVLADHFANRADNSFQIWNLLTLSIWWRQFIQNKGEA